MHFISTNIRESAIDIEHEDNPQSLEFMTRKLFIMAYQRSRARNILTLGIVHMVCCTTLCYSELSSGIVEFGNWYGWDASGLASGGIVYLVHDIPATGVLYKVYAYLQTTQKVYLQIWESLGDDNYFIKYQTSINSPEANYSKVIHLNDGDNNCPAVTAGLHKLGIWSPDTLTVPIPYYDTTPQSQIITTKLPDASFPPFVGLTLKFQSTFNHPFLIQGYIHAYENKDTGIAVTFSEVGSLLASVERVHGNNVTKRSAFLPTGAQKSWLDSETKLPAGRLQEFYFYMHSISGLGPKNVLIQIWRHTAEYQYQLVWQRNISINQEYSNGAIVKVDCSEDDAFITQTSDRIGWGFHDSVGFISFDYVEGHRTYFTKSSTTSDRFIPEVSKSYEFDNVHLPARYSVAVKIDTSQVHMMRYCPCDVDLNISTTTRYPTPTTTATPQMTAIVTPALVIYISVAVAGVVIIIVTITIVCCVLKLRSRSSKDKGSVINAEPGEPQKQIDNPAFDNTSEHEHSQPKQVEHTDTGATRGDEYEYIQEQNIHVNRQLSLPRTIINDNPPNPPSNTAEDIDFGDYLLTDLSLAPRADNGE